MKHLLLSIASVFLFILQISAQPACRRNSTGIAYTTLLPDGTYNFYGTSFDASAMCLPPTTIGTPCIIRGIFTYQGTYGNYSVINCNFDKGIEYFLLPVLLAIGLIALRR
ncbi:hypothetical protein ASE74_15860 [Pedobacter sp. Leaf216]|uniref:hypothetical protein n=1 Tax=Pedobacter sp. Leaf216 TaxID=1735684 RepID=UPI0007137489|nr:hypothetical protein [Pedobacter sp. Leaf216]KQM77874.1 hypothetical protein ASE74_15860 [Pedobacter sp. Leaf216]